jgi:trimethylamine---corrinoid protein Co-methyltransferase
VFENRFPRLEPLSADALDTLERGWMRLVSEVGVQFDHPEALRHLAEAGQRVDGSVVYLDPEFVLEQVALAPETFTLHARNPARNVELGGDTMIFMPVQGPPFVRRGAARGDGTMADFDDFCRLAQHLDDFDSAGGLPCEPNDTPLDSRHLDIVRSLLVLTDKPFQGSQISGVAARDSLALGRIAFRDRIDEGACMYTNVNVNSPLRYDERMLEALLEYAAAGQAVVVTPFLLMGAMAPVTIPAALVQQTAEALTGIALCQLVNPGCPVVLGSFLSNIDMQSGSPGFGGPESSFGLLASGQLARRYRLPWRSGGGSLTTSPLPDAQAAYEGTNTMLSAFLAGANLVMHTGGWLEGGLVASFEKLVIDLEIVRTLRAEFTQIEVDEASLAFDAHVEVGQGGHFLGAAHTLERFRTCFYRPLVSTTENFERWTRNGARDTAARASELVEKLLGEYEQPALDDAVLAEIDEYVVRRRRELGD